MEQELQQHLSDRIRLRAYEIWMASGADGEAEQHWLAAEQEILSATQRSVPPTMAKASEKRTAGGATAKRSKARGG